MSRLPTIVALQIVVFDNLTPEQLREIVRHMANDIGSRLRSRNIVLVMTDRALDAVVQIVRAALPLSTDDPSTLRDIAQRSCDAYAGAGADAHAEADAAGELMLQLFLRAVADAEADTDADSELLQFRS